MTAGNRRDPYVSFLFLLEIGGVIRGGFSEVSGLQVETVTEEYHEGGVNDFVHVLPSGVRHPRLILRRGMTDCDILWKWFRDTAAGSIRFRSGSIVILDYQGREKVRWEFRDAYPVKWVGPDFRADSGSIAIETLELAHKGFQKT